MIQFLADTCPQHLEIASHAIKGEGNPINILFSYHYFRKDRIDRHLARWAPGVRVFADSGAVSVTALGIHIDPWEYANWLLKWESHFFAYANLDVKGDVKKTLENQQILEDRGLTPVPVFHGGESWSLLDDYISQYPYVAIGGMARSASSGGSDSQYHFLDKVFERAGSHKLHGFGLASWKILLRYPWYSVDSSAWGAGYRFGRIAVFDQRVGIFRHFKLYDVKRLRQRAGLLRSYDCDWRNLAYRSQYHRRYVTDLSARSYSRAEKWLNNYKGETNG